MSPPPSHEGRPAKIGAKVARKSASRTRRGRDAERVAIDYLEAAGFTILGTNVRLGYLEIDVMARKGPLVVLVEVRTRGPRSYVGAFGSVTAVKRRRLQQAAERAWRLMRDDPTIERVRIDCAAVDLSTTPVTIEIATGIVLPRDVAAQDSSACMSSRRPRSERSACSPPPPFSTSAIAASSFSISTD